MRKNLAEILEKFSMIEDREEQITYLRRNITRPLANYLKAAYLPGVEWTIEEFPKYNDPGYVQGHAPSSLEAEERKMYLFEKNNPKRKDLEKKKHDDLLVRFLTSVERNEAELFKKIVKQETPLVPNLTIDLLRETFPGHF